MATLWGDTFSIPKANIAGTSPEVGNQDTYHVLGGTWSVSGGKLCVTEAPGSNTKFYFSFLPTEYRFSIKIKGGYADDQSSQSVIFYLRSYNILNCFYVIINVGSLGPFVYNVVIHKVVSGNDTIVASAMTNPFVEGAYYPCVITVSSTNIAVSINGVNFNINDTYNDIMPGVFIRYDDFNSAVNLPLFDDLLIEGLPTGGGLDFSLTGSGGAVGGGTGLTGLIITNATNTSPIVVTTETPHGMAVGVSDALVSITNVLGNIAANGAWIPVVVDANNFYLAASSGSGAFTSSPNGRASIFPRPINKNITYASNTSSIIITCIGHGLINSPHLKVWCNGVRGNSAANMAATYDVINADHLSLDNSVGNGNYVAPANVKVLITNQSNDIKPVEYLAKTTPIEILSLSHGLVTGDSVTVINAGGIVEANGTWPVTRTDADRFTLNGSAGVNDWTGGGTFTKAGRLIPLTNASNTTPVVITSVAHGVVNGDNATIRDVTGNDGANVNDSEVTKINNDTFSLNGSVGTGVMRTDGGLLNVIPNYSGVTSTGTDEDFEEEFDNFDEGGDIVLGTPVAGKNPFENASDGDHFDYIMTIGEGVFEIGRAYYHAATDKILKYLIQYSHLGVNVTVPPPVPPSDDGAITAVINIAASLTEEEKELYAIANSVGDYIIDVQVSSRMGVGHASVIYRNRVFHKIVMHPLPTEQWMYALVQDGYLTGEQLIASEAADLSRILVPGIRSTRDSVLWCIVKGEVWLFNQGELTAAQIANFRTTPFQRLLSPAEVTVLFETFGTRGANALNLPTLNYIIAGAAITKVSRIRTVLNAALAAGEVAGAILNAYIVIKAVGDELAATQQVKLTQGRLQLVPIVANSDRDRCGFGSTLYYVPCFQEEPREARITLYKPVWVGAPVENDLDHRFSHYPIVLENGKLPKLDLNQASAMPFNFDAAKINTNALVDGIPADVFICFPENPSYNDFEPPISNRPQDQPRLFFINWHEARSRNNGLTGAARRGFELTNTTEMNLCLKAISTDSDGFIIDNMLVLGALMRRTESRLYPYLGTVVKVKGFVYCTPGVRNLWNYYNRINYDDWRQFKHTIMWMNCKATNGFKAYLDISYSYISHQFVDPTDGTSNLPSLSGSLRGAFSVSILGPISIEIQHSPSNQRMVCDNLPETNIPTYASGSVEAVPTNIEMGNLRFPAGFTPTPGANAIVCYQELNSDIDCTHKGYAFLGTQISFYYVPNFGFPKLGNTGSMVLAASDVSNKTRGFGFRGDC